MISLSIANRTALHCRIAYIYVYMHEMADRANFRVHLTFQLRRADFDLRYTQHK